MGVAVLGSIVVTSLNFSVNGGETHPLSPLRDASKQAGKKDGLSSIEIPDAGIKWIVTVILRLPSAKSKAGDAMANPSFASTMFLVSGAIESCEVPNKRQPLLSEDFTKRCIVCYERYCAAVLLIKIQ